MGFEQDPQGPQISTQIAYRGFYSPGPYNGGQWEMSKGFRALKSLLNLHIEDFAPQDPIMVVNGKSAYVAGGLYSFSIGLHYRVQMSKPFYMCRS